MNMTEVSDKLIAQGFQLSGKTIFLNGEIVGWLHDMSFAIKSDLPRKGSMAITTTIFFSDIQLDKKIRRQYRMLITSARRYDKYKRNERIRAVKKYFLNRKYSVPSTELSPGILDTFISSYHEWKRKLEEDNRNERVQKLRDAIALHRTRSE